MWHICIEESEKKFNLLYIFNDLDELIFSGFFKEQRTHLCNLRQHSGQRQAPGYTSSTKFSPHELHQCIHHCFQRYLYNASKFSTAKQRRNNSSFICNIYETQLNNEIVQPSFGNNTSNLKKF